MKKISSCTALSFLVLVVETSAHAAIAELDPFNSDVSIVLTPTRLRQSLSDVPGSVTVLTSDMMTRFGIRAIPEALRLVPGMAVTQISGGDYRISYHGTNIIAPRRMNVLIDGMSVYRSAFARVDWTALPVALEDIERIEVTRGPNSASYGANSMLAIVNIITKHPKEAEGVTFKATGGTRGTAEGMARFGGKIGEATNYRVTLEQQQNKGFSSVAGINTGPVSTPDHDASRVSKFNFRSITDIANNETLDLQLAILKRSQDVQMTDAYQKTFPDVRAHEYDINAIWKKSLSENHEIQIQAYLSQHKNDEEFKECIPTLAFLPQMAALWRANPSYVNAIIAGKTPAGGSPTDNALAFAALAAIRALGPRAVAPTCGDANNNYRERRSDIEFQDTYVFSESFRAVSGIGFRRDMATSQTYLGGSSGNNSWRAFTNVEYKPVPSLIVNAGGFYEKDQLTGGSFSPRIALNKHIDTNNTVRFVVSRANRMPDIIEKRANWSYLTTNLTPPLNGATQAYFAQSARASGLLQEERITSREIGYTGNFPQYGLMIDAKVFDDRLTDLVSERLNLANYNPTNKNFARLRGAEFQMNYEPAERWTIHAGYSYLLNEASTVLEQGQYSKNSGFLGVTHILQNGWRGSLLLNESQGGTIGQSSFGQQNLTISKVYRLGKDMSVTPTFTVTHLDKRAMQYMFDIDRSTTNSYASPMQYFLNVKLTY